MCLFDKHLEMRSIFYVESKGKKVSQQIRKKVDKVVSPLEEEEEEEEEGEDYCLAWLAKLHEKKNQPI